MPNFERMDIDELEANRNKIARQRDALKAEFMAAGKVLDVKRQDETLRAEYENLKAKQREIEVKLQRIGG